MAYKGSYKTLTRKDLSPTATEAGVDPVSLPESAFYGKGLLEKIRRVISLMGVSLCLGCGVRLPREARFCQRCELEYRRAKTWECGVCGKRLTACDCSSAFLSRNGVPRAVKLLHYHSGRPDAVENHAVLFMKRKNVQPVFRFFAAELEPGVRRLLPTDGEAVLTFVPRPKERRSTYGFDQAQRLAEALAERMDLPVVRSLKRTSFSPTQKEMETMTERVANAKRSFAPVHGENVRGKTVLLVDDVVTTGATMAAAASLLREQGAKRVYAVIVATSMRHPNIKYAHAENTHMPRYEAP